jgi:hypothetical protein
MNNDERITYFGQTDARGKKLAFGIKAKDRSRHMYVIGKTGMGKSTLLENMAVQDVRNGEGFTFMDPHGSAAEKILDYIPEERMKDVLYFAPFDLAYPVSFNVLENVDADKRHFVVSGLMSTFEKIWEDMWSARMAYILQNTLMALLEYPEATLLGVNRMYVDKDFRKKVIENVTDPGTRSFWVDEYSKYTDRYTQEATPAIQNKIGQFSSNALVRNIIGQPKSAFDTRELIDSKKIFIVNLSKGRVGEGNANLLGSMLITKLYLAALSRADASGPMLKSLPNHYLYVDEFQSFANRSFADILSEARKYKLNLLMAHQYVEQMEEEVRSAVFGNVGTMVTFRVGAYDAELLEKEFAPVFFAMDLVNLGFAQIYLKLMIDGVSSQPFSAVTLPPLEMPEVSFRDQIIANSRKTYAAPREQVEEAIAKWHDPVVPSSSGAGGGVKQDKPQERSQSRSDRPQERTGDRPTRSGGGERGDRRDRGERELGSGDRKSRDTRNSPREPRQEARHDSRQEMRSESSRGSSVEHNRETSKEIPKETHREDRRGVSGTDDESTPRERKHEESADKLRDILKRVAQENVRENSKENTSPQVHGIGGIRKGFSDGDREELKAVVTHALNDAGISGGARGVLKHPPQTQKQVQESDKSRNSSEPKEIPEGELKKMMHVDR